MPIYKEDIETIVRSAKSVFDCGCPHLTIVSDGIEREDPTDAIYTALEVFDESADFQGGINGVFEVQYINLHQNVGCAEARNIGIHATPSDIVAVLDCGDIFYANKGEQARWMLENEYPATFSRCIDEETGDVRRLVNNWQRECFRGNQFQLSTTVFDKRKCLAVGSIPPSWYRSFLRFGSDTEFHARVQKQVGWACYDKVTGTATEWRGGISDAYRARDYRKTLFDRNVSVLNMMISAYELGRGIEPEMPWSPIVDVQIRKLVEDNDNFFSGH